MLPDVSLKRGGEEVPVEQRDPAPPLTQPPTLLKETVPCFILQDNYSQ